MLTRFLYIPTLACAALVWYGEALSVERGSRDVFDNPNCTNPSEECSVESCRRFNAECQGDDCEKCECFQSHNTFLTSINHCVNNIYLLLFPVNYFESSFLVQEPASVECVTYNRQRSIVRAKCNQSDLSQRWFWTQNKQLLNANNLECLQPNETFYSPTIQVYLKHGDCSTTVNARMVWKCDSEKMRFSFTQRLSITNWRYVFIKSTKYFIRPSQCNNRIPCTMWQRSPSKNTLCSTAFGCHAFVNSSVVTLNTNCSPRSSCKGKKEIFPRLPAPSATCSIMPEKSHFLEKTKWVKLLSTKDIFTLSQDEMRNVHELNWNLKNTSSAWLGRIIKLHFNCTWKMSGTLTTGCLIVKMEGTHRQKFFPTNSSNTQDRQKGEASNDGVIIAIVCPVLAFVVFFLIFIGFVLYKRSHSRKIEKTMDNPTYTQTSPDPLRLEIDTYQEPNTVLPDNSNVYESGEGNRHYYSKPQDKGGDEIPLSPLTYDYAKNDDIRKAVPRFSRQNCAAQENEGCMPGVETNTTETENDKTPVPVYDILEDAGVDGE